MSLRAHQLNPFHSVYATFQSSRTTQSAYEHNEVSSPTSAHTRPAPSSHASNSTIGKISTHSMPNSRPFANQAQLQRADSNRQLAKAIMKKKQLMKDFAGARKIGGAETAGSEADESHVANSEAPNIRRKVRQKYLCNVRIE